jgi:hypothetical protein
MCKLRWIEERAEGYTKPDGTVLAPVTREEAEKIWNEKTHERFEWAMFDPEVIEKFKLDQDEKIPADATAIWMTRNFERPSPAVEAPTLDNESKNSESSNS